MHENDDDDCNCDNGAQQCGVPSGWKQCDAKSRDRAHGRVQLPCIYRPACITFVIGDGRRDPQTVVGAAGVLASVAAADGGTDNSVQRHAVGNQLRGSACGLELVGCVRAHRLDEQNLLWVGQ